MTDFGGTTTSGRAPRAARPFTRLAKLLTAPILTLLAACATLPAMAQPSTGATITFAEQATVDGDGATATGARVVITAGGTYVITGQAINGSVTVDAAGADVTLVLSGLDLTNAEGPAIYVAAAGSATVTLAAGSSNQVADGGSSEYDAALYSDAPLIIDGEGALDVHAVYEGISSTSHIDIKGGTIRIFATEDGINANEDGVSRITVSGGYVYVQTDTGDGIDSNGTITITGGVVVTQAALVDANSGLDADGDVTIDGGVVVATGSQMMGSVATDSAQETIVVNYGASQAAGTLIVVRDEAGNDLLAFAPANGYQQLLFSSPALQDGVTYTVYSGGTPTGVGVDGLYAAGAADPGTAVATVTTESAQGGGGFGPGFGGPGAGRGAPGRP